MYVRLLCVDATTIIVLLALSIDQFDLYRENEFNWKYGMETTIINIYHQHLLSSWSTSSPSSSWSYIITIIINMSSWSTSLLSSSSLASSYHHPIQHQYNTLLYSTLLYSTQLLYRLCLLYDDHQLLGVLLLSCSRIVLLDIQI